MNLSFINIVLNGKESEPVGDERVRIDNLVLILDNLTKGRDSVVPGMHELLYL